MKVVLFHPDIPQNTGNIGRTCVAIGATLVLVRPLGFHISDKFIKRAGMDYWDHVDLHIVDSLEEALGSVPRNKIYLLTTKGHIPYFHANLDEGGVYLFGSESSGLPADVMEAYRDCWYTVPMKPGTRSLNLATTVGLVMYEAVRQNFSRRSW